MPILKPIHGHVKESAEMTLKRPIHILVFLAGIGFAQTAPGATLTEAYTEFQREPTSLRAHDDLIRVIPEHPSALELPIVADLVFHTLDLLNGLLSQPDGIRPGHVSRAKSVLNLLPKSPNHRIPQNLRAFETLSEIFEGPRFKALRKHLSRRDDEIRSLIKSQRTRFRATSSGLSGLVALLQRCFSSHPLSSE
jgi:hypothetical protein